MALVKFAFFLSLIATKTIAEISRHGNPITGGVEEKKVEDQEEGIRKILRKNKPLVLEHVVNICQLEPR